MNRNPTIWIGAVIALLGGAVCGADEVFPVLHGDPIAVRVLDGKDGNPQARTRVVLTAGYDRRDLKLAQWREELLTFECAAESAVAAGGSAESAWMRARSRECGSECGADSGKRSERCEPVRHGCGRECTGCAHGFCEGDEGCFKAGLEGWFAGKSLQNTLPAGGFCCGTPPCGCCEFRNLFQGTSGGRFRTDIRVPTGDTGARRACP